MHLSISDPTFYEAARRVKFLGVDFDGVMTDNTVYVFEDGREAVRCSRFEGFGLRRLDAVGVEPMIISTEVNPVVGARAAKLKMSFVQAVEDKVEIMEVLLKERGLSWEQAAFIGNDVNDRDALRKVGLPVVVADAHRVLDDIHAYRTARPGGAGAVREICDAIASALERKA